MASWHSGVDPICFWGGSKWVMEVQGLTLLVLCHSGGFYVDAGGSIFVLGGS